MPFLQIKLALELILADLSEGDLTLDHHVQAVGRADDPFQVFPKLFALLVASNCFCRVSLVFEHLQGLKDYVQGSDLLMRKRVRQLLLIVLLDLAFLILDNLGLVGDDRQEPSLVRKLQWFDLDAEHLHRKRIIDIIARATTPYTRLKLEVRMAVVCVVLKNI